MTQKNSLNVWSCEKTKGCFVTRAKKVLNDTEEFGNIWVSNEACLTLNNACRGALCYTSFVAKIADNYFEVVLDKK